MAYIIRRGPWPHPPVGIILRPSALKHRISEERIRHVVLVCPQPLANPRWPGQAMYLAPDSYRNPIEVMGEFDDVGVLWVIHAMALRRRYERLYMEVNGHR